MFDFIWECMSISYMGMLGMIFWSISISVFGFTIACFAYFVSGEWKKPKKPKYNGEKIIIQGGKKDE
ncbi:unnamed protein product [marine sediment metagenome]|uniref:Uncharacterized protein n=1 Tax=marine sediment metagenome TaxID=412755 RepID=X1DQR4_9ZZZZ